MFCTNYYLCFCCAVNFDVSIQFRFLLSWYLCLQQLRFGTNRMARSRGSVEAASHMDLQATAALSRTGGMSMGSASSARLSSLGPAAMDVAQEPVALGHLQRQSSDFRLAEEEEEDDNLGASGSAAAGSLRLSLSIGGLARSKSGVLSPGPAGPAGLPEVRAPVASKVAEKKAGGFKFVM
jgi:hypothetical protein